MDPALSPDTKMKRIIIYTCLILITAIQHSAAQTYTISGNVKSVNGEAVASASITLKSTSYAVVCDVNGNCDERS